ncbi:hypothetical protein SeLEV6574_g00923 [Synchytrium endobioticum]|uniref:Prolyl endopeptidase n=1 Tax=Synchytrium endobioticum TaxID=286115 RepID=A0A507DFT7_9FUNG|nr:hypothetical protein SeLEV6574_g00923 [Synchytrium endobioticum]
MATKVQKVMVAPINVIFKHLQSKTRVKIWLFEQVDMRIEGKIIGFDEFMNLVIDDAEEIYQKSGNVKPTHSMFLRAAVGRSQSISNTLRKMVVTTTTGITASTSPFNYPAVRRDESVLDKLHDGKTTVADPYRWLEDPDSAETKDFVKAQNELFKSYVSSSSLHDKFEKRLTEMFNYERFGCPFKRGSSYYYFFNSGLQAQSVLYKQDSLDGAPRIFFDPNTLSEDGTVSLNTYAFTEDGKYFAYGLSASGSDWVTIRVRSTADDAPEDLEPQPVEWAKFTSIAWTHDNKGFFYNRYTPPAKIPNNSDKGTETDTNKNQSVMYHAVGSGKPDLLIHMDPENSDWMFGCEVSDDGRYLLLIISRSCDPETKVYIADIGHESIAGPPKWNPIVDDFKAEYHYITNDDTVFYFQTTLDAPRKRVVKYDLARPDVGMVEVIPQTQDVIQQCRVVDQNKLIIAYLHNVKHITKMYTLPHVEPLSPQSLPLAEGSIITSMTGRKEDPAVFYQSSSFVTPGIITRFDFQTMEPAVFRTTSINGHDDTKFQVTQEWYTSTGNVQIPMYIISKKGTKLDGNNPCLLYAYGGFNIPILPSFSVTWLTFIQHMDGIVASASIRGGSEFGESWYKDGKLDKKQNCFDDFQNAAKHLVSTGWTRPGRLAINGGSNGGLLVGACANQAPDLFGCAIADVGVMDMTRFHRFTIGHAWTSDYGNPDRKEDFDVLIKYSPLHNVRSQGYPAYLLTTSDHDDRVVPLHSYKLVATLQYVAGPVSDQPIMIRIETKAGHGAGKSTKQRIEEAADKYAFMAQALKLEWQD